MTTKQLYAYHNARPFKPFHIRMADGREYLVDHPEMLAYAEGARLCAVWDADAEAFIQLDLLLMTSINPVSTKSSKGSRKAS